MLVTSKIQYNYTKGLNCKYTDNSHDLILEIGVDKSKDKFKEAHCAEKYKSCENSTKYYGPKCLPSHVPRENIERYDTDQASKQYCVSQDEVQIVQLSTQRNNESELLKTLKSQKLGVFAN